MAAVGYVTVFDMAGLFRYWCHRLPRSYIRERNVKAVFIAIVFLSMVLYFSVIRPGTEVLRSETATAVAVKRLCDAGNAEDLCMIELRMPSGEVSAAGMTRPWPVAGDKVPIRVDYLADGTRRYSVKSIDWEMQAMDQGRSR